MQLFWFLRQITQTCPYTVQCIDHIKINRNNLRPILSGEWFRLVQLSYPLWPNNSNWYLDWLLRVISNICKPKLEIIMTAGVLCDAYYIRSSGKHLSCNHAITISIRPSGPYICFYVIRPSSPFTFSYVISRSPSP